MTGEELKQSILQMAIQGKLVPQDSENDEPAWKLLERIKKEKDQLIKEKKIKKEKALKKPLKVDAYYAELPPNWESVELCDLFNFIDYRGMTPKKSEEGIFLTTASNIKNGFMDYKRKEYISYSEYLSRQSRGITHKGDILFTTEAPMGNVALCEMDQTSCGQRVVTLQPFEAKSLFPSLYRDFLLSSQFQLLLKNNATGTTAQGIKGEYLLHLPIPLPPLEEQKRIVAKLEELQPLIDRYTQLEQKLSKLNQEFPQKLKESILQEAIQGKLTEQDYENDEPAWKLLERIKEEKEKLIKEKKIKREKTLPPISEEEKPFEIPNNWEWVRLGNLPDFSRPNCFCDGPFGSNLKREHQTNEKEVRIIQLSNIGITGWKNENEKYTTFEHLNNCIPRCEVFPKDFVIAKMMPAGRSIIVPDLGTRICLGSDVIRLALNPKIHSSYILDVLNSSMFYSQIYTDVKGITRVRTTLGNLRTYLIPLPPIEEQKRIVAKLEELQLLIDKLNQKIISY